jgi:hypothetical protein
MEGVGLVKSVIISAMLQFRDNQTHRVLPFHSAPIDKIMYTFK